MPRNFQRQDLELLGYQKTELLQETPCFTLYGVAALAGLEEVPSQCLHVKTAITNDEAHKVSRMRSPKGQNFVIYHSGLGDRISKLKDILGHDRTYF